MDITNFCARPFVLCNITPNGNFSPCCRIPDGFGNVKNETLENLWNSEKMIQLRKDFLDNKRPSACQDCWGIESRGLQSERLSSGNQFLTEEFKEQIFKNNLNGRVDSFECLEIRPSNRCNFMCRMCHPDVSSSWHDLNKKAKLYDSENDKILMAYQNTNDLMRDIQPFVSNVKYIKIHGGEPMFEPQVLEILKSFQDYKQNIWLRWITNLSIVDHPFYTSELLSGWKKTATTVSLDGPPLVSEYIRRGQKTVLFEKNLIKLKRVTPDVFIHIALQALNVIRIPEFIEYILMIEPYRVTMNKVEEPKALKVNVLPSSIKKEALIKLLDYREKFKTKNISIRLKNDLQDLITEGICLLEEKDQSSEMDLWNHFLHWNRAIDGEYKNLLFVYPEFSPYIDEQHQ